MELDAWRGRMRTLESIGMWGSTHHRVSTDAGAQTVDATYVSTQLFATLDAPMALGRSIADADRRSPVAVISHRLWTRQFAASPDVLGRSLILDDHHYAVVGVARADFQFPSEGVDVWTPLGYAQVLNTEAWVNSPRGGGFNFIARMRQGVTLDAVRKPSTSPPSQSARRRR